MLILCRVSGRQSWCLFGAGAEMSHESSLMWRSRSFWKLKAQRFVIYYLVTQILIIVAVLDCRVSVWLLIKPNVNVWAWRGGGVPPGALCLCCFSTFVCLCASPGLSECPPNVYSDSSCLRPLKLPFPVACQCLRREERLFPHKQGENDLTDRDLWGSGLLGVFRLTRTRPSVIFIPDVRSFWLEFSRRHWDVRQLLTHALSLMEDPALSSRQQ